MENDLLVAKLVFFITILATYAAAFLARAHGRHGGGEEDELAGLKLNRWLVGLSAATTANSGFIVTAAVGLGYLYGMQWVLLPLSWMVGDLVFWKYFPYRINEFGRTKGVSTMSELLCADIQGTTGAPFLSKLCAVLIVVCLAGYTAAQWLAGEKFLAGAFGYSGTGALVLFAILIIAYSSIGGFRGSVYTDTLQAVIRIVGTLIALAAIWHSANELPDFRHNIAAAGDQFLNPFGMGGPLAVIGFILGFAAAAVGFGLGQPQILTRYLAGKDPQETQDAKWIYIWFVQFTWIAMTVFGVALRGVMPGLEDPEAGLSTFFQSKVNAVATGIIVADVFATIASTSNGILISMAQSVKFDLLGQRRDIGFSRVPIWAITVFLGLITMLMTSVIEGSVVTLALSSVSLMGAGLAGAVMVKLLGWRHTAISLLCSVVTGVVAAIVWKLAGLSSLINESGVGMAFALLANWLVWRLQARFIAA
jgi:sodium/proline symporter